MGGAESVPEATRGVTHEPIFKSRLPGTAKPVRVFKGAERAESSASGKEVGDLVTPEKPGTAAELVDGDGVASPGFDVLQDTPAVATPAPPITSPDPSASPTPSAAPVSTPSPAVIRVPRAADCRNAEAHESKVLRLEKILSQPNLDLKLLCNVCWSGLVPEYRPLVWRLLLGYMPSHSERREATVLRLRKDYFENIPELFNAERSEYEEGQWRQIVVDLPRTNPSVLLFQSERVQQCLHRILYSWAIRHPATGYVQGINDLATPFFYVFLTEYLAPEQARLGEGLETLAEAALDAVEADTYYCLTRMLDSVQDNYTFAQKGIQRKIFELKRLVRRVDEPLHIHLEAECVYGLCLFSSDTAQRFLAVCLALDELPSDA